ncbi:MAG: polyphenol oxidase family protein [Bdellovibrionales bacterium]|nr:polyphenol oxidase family protein [Bdellovibrionales bacterium]
MKFDLLEKGRFQFLAYKPWLTRSLEHGFIGRNSDFSESNLRSILPEFCESFQVQALCLPDQVHGRNVLDFTKRSLVREFLSARSAANSNERLFPADAILISRSEIKREFPLAFGIRTADCVPIALVADDVLALVHAGWRGLANGLLERVVTMLYDAGGVGKVEALIGPCAGFESYEVGSEVIDAIGDDAVCKERGSQKYLLGLAETAHRILDNFLGPRLIVERASLCTIESPLFHSFRRDNERAGRNLMFVVLRD